MLQLRHTANARYTFFFFWFFFCFVNILLLFYFNNLCGAIGIFTQFEAAFVDVVDRRHTQAKLLPARVTGNVLNFVF